MTVFVASDLHLNHENIIEYCDRPFESAKQMDGKLINNWNRKVAKNDVVYFLGDLTFEDEEQAKEYISRLNGNILFVEGDHDETSFENSYQPMVEHCVIRYNKYKFCCVHDPADVPEAWSGWVIHGHHHNNHPAEFPLVHPKKKTINVSIELIDYEPIRLDTIISLLEKEEKVVRIQD